MSLLGTDRSTAVLPAPAAPAPVIPAEWAERLVYGASPASPSLACLGALTDAEQVTLLGFYEQKATVIVEHIAYDPTGETYVIDIFTKPPPKLGLNRAVKSNCHVYDYVVTDSDVERRFVNELDASTEVVVYTKLPNGFFIPTPVGDYNPDWAIAFQQGKVKHVYFVAETKGSMSSMDLRKIEESKIECARKFFAKITSDQVKHDVVDGYGKLMELVATA